MSVAGIRRTITLRTCDLKDNMKPRYSDTGSIIYSNQYKYDVHMTHMMHYAFICTTSSHEISSMNSYSCDRSEELILVCSLYKLALCKLSALRVVWSSRHKQSIRHGTWTSNINILTLLV